MARIAWFLLPAVLGRMAGAELPRVPEERRADTYAVYSAALSRPTLSHANTNLKYLIFGATGLVREGSTESCVRPPAARQGALREIARESARLRNAAFRLDRALTLSKPYELLTAQETASFIDPRRRPPSPELARRLAGATDLITLGNVYFDSQRTLAAVAISNYCGPACGGTVWRVFEKSNGRWEERDWIQCVRVARYAGKAPAFSNAASTASFPNCVLMNNSCRAPALSAMAFQPFCVGTVMRTRTLPLASRTGRITPGITLRISGLALSNSSSTPRTPSMMLCSTFRRSLAVRRRI
jgi:hypothetical protein